jgi:NhaP-type Na+/H+ or K+/H+ antiporter
MWADKHLFLPLLVLVQVARTVTIGVFYPLLCTGRIGYAMNWRTAVVMVWAGLRGAVSLLSPVELSDRTHFVCGQQSCRMCCTVVQYLQVASEHGSTWLLLALPLQLTTDLI